MLLIVKMEKQQALDECFQRAAELKRLWGKQCDRHTSDTMWELVQMGMDERVKLEYVVNAGYKADALRRTTLNNVKQKLKKDATADRLRAKLQSRKG
jgi:hypothetical protein